MLLSATIAVSLFTLTIPWLAAHIGLFGFTPLPMPVLASSLAIVTLYAVATETVKRIVRSNVTP
jgi:hypothetical protein